MKEIQDIALILKKIPYQDDDAIVELFSQEHGVISVVAKGLFKSTSKNKGHCFVGSMVRVEYFLSSEEQSIGRLKRFTPYKPFVSDFYRDQSFVGLLCETLLLYLPKNQAEPKILRLYELYLQNKKFESMPSFSFLLSFFSLLGILPDFTGSRNLFEVPVVYFHETKGLQSVCFSEEKNFKLEYPLLKSLFYLARGNFEIASHIDFSLSQQKRMWEFLWWFHAFHVKIMPKSKKVMESMGIL